MKRYVDGNCTAKHLTAVLGIEVGQEIKSIGYTAGVNGWRIDGAGNLDVNNGLFRGEVRAGSLILADVDKTLHVPYASFVPPLPSVPLSYNLGYLTRDSVGSVTAVASIILPIGVTLQSLRMRAYRQTASDVVTLEIDRLNSTAVVTNLGSLTHTLTGWQTAGTSLSGTVAVGDTYRLWLTLTNNAAIANARLLYVELDYHMSDYRQGY